MQTWLLSWLLPATFLAGYFAGCWLTARKERDAIAKILRALDTQLAQRQHHAAQRLVRYALWKMHKEQ